MRRMYGFKPDCDCGCPDFGRHEPFCGIPECDVCGARHEGWQRHDFLEDTA